MKKGIALALFFICVLSAASAADEAVKREQLDIRIDQIISSDYPSMTAFAVVRDGKGEPVSGLAPGLFISHIDTQAIKAKTSVVQFSMTDEKVDYTILVSNNGIMEGEPLDFQKNAIIQFVDLMNKNDTLSVYTIGEQAVPVFEDVGKDSVDPSLVNGIAIAESQPRVYDSLMNILRKVEAKKTRRKIIIVISDGRDQDSRFTMTQLSSALSDTGIPVYTIGMKVLSAQSLGALDQIADKSGGMYIYTPLVKYIPANLKYIFSCVTKCYVIHYKVRSVKPDNNAHLLEVSIEAHDSYGKGQKTFVAVKLPVPKWMRVLIAVIIISVIVVFIVLIIIRKIRKRKSMGITGRRCPDCGNRMKDNWDYCPFCRYKPELKKKKRGAPEKIDKPKVPKAPK
jgi:von Willebrand factor type A domain.